MSVRSILIKMFSRTHTAEETAGMIMQLLGLDTPKDDHGHWYKEAGAACPHDNGMAKLNEEQRKKATKIVKALSGKNPKVNRKAQDQHINAKNAAEATRRDREKHQNRFRWAKSYFTVKMQAAHAMVLDSIRKGKYIVKKGYGKIYLLVNVEKEIGIWYNRNDQKKPSSVIRVDWSDKEGYHIYPTGDDDE